LPGSSDAARRCQANGSRVRVNDVVVEAKEGDEGEWMPVHGVPVPSDPVPTAPEAPSRYLSEHIAQVIRADRTTGEHAHSNVSAALYHSYSAPRPDFAVIIHIRTLTGDNPEAVSHC
jgi:hypothetical protein